MTSTNEMKILLLTLVLGLVCADQGPQSKKDPELVSGRWRAFYMASSDKQKMRENEPFQAFLRRIDFDCIPDEITFTFFVMVNGQCVEKSSVATQKTANVYTSDYAGKTEFQILHLSNNALIGYIVNVDKNGKVTGITTLLGKGDYAEGEDIYRFKKVTREKKIPEENIVNLLKIDNCPTRG